MCHTLACEDHMQLPRELLTHTHDIALELYCMYYGLPDLAGVHIYIYKYIYTHTHIYDKKIHKII